MHLTIRPAGAELAESQGLRAAAVVADRDEKPMMALVSHYDRPRIERVCVPVSFVARGAAWKWVDVDDWRAPGIWLSRVALELRKHTERVREAVQQSLRYAAEDPFERGLELLKESQMPKKTKTDSYEAPAIVKSEAIAETEATERLEERYQRRTAADLEAAKAAGHKGPTARGITTLLKNLEQDMPPGHERNRTKGYLERALEWADKTRDATQG